MSILVYIQLQALIIKFTSITHSLEVEF